MTEINLRIKLPQHEDLTEPQREELGALVVEWIADGLFPEESVVQLVNNGFGQLVPDELVRQGRFNPETNRPRPAAEARRTFT
jgi:hypothetical protein